MSVRPSSRPMRLGPWLVRGCRQARERQVLVLAAAALALLVIPFGLAAWGVIQERADHATVAALLRSAAEAGATGLTGPSAPPVQPGSVTCAPLPQAGTPAGRACQAFADGLRQHYGGPYARVQVAAALAATQVQILDGTPVRAVSDAITGQTYHYPTVCIEAAIRIGVFAHDGLGFVHHVAGCAQNVYRP